MPYRNEKKKGEELLSHASDLPSYSLEKSCFARTGSKQIAILVYVIGEWGRGQKGVSPYTECCSLNSLYLTTAILKI